MMSKFIFVQVIVVVLLTTDCHSAPAPQDIEGIIGEGVSGINDGLTGMVEGHPNDESPDHVPTEHGFNNPEHGVINGVMDYAKKTGTTAKVLNGFLGGQDREGGLPTARPGSFRGNQGGILDPSGATAATHQPGNSAKMEATQNPDNQGRSDNSGSHNMQ